MLRRVDRCGPGAGGREGPDPVLPRIVQPELRPDFPVVFIHILEGVALPGIGWCIEVKHQGIRGYILKQRIAHAQRSEHSPPAEAIPAMTVADFIVEQLALDDQVRAAQLRRHAPDVGAHGDAGTGSGLYLLR